MIYRQFRLDDDIEDSILEEAKKHAGLRRVRINPIDYRRAGWRRYGPVTYLALMPEVKFKTAFLPDEAPAMLDIRRIEVLVDHDLPPGNGYWVPGP